MMRFQSADQDGARRAVTLVLVLVRFAGYTSFRIQYRYRSVPVGYSLCSERSSCCEITPDLLPSPSFLPQARPLGHVRALKINS